MRDAAAALAEGIAGVCAGHEEDSIRDALVAVLVDSIFRRAEDRGVRHVIADVICMRLRKRVRERGLVGRFKGGWE